MAALSGRDTRVFDVGSSGKADAVRTSRSGSEDLKRKSRILTNGALAPANDGDVESRAVASPGSSMNRMFKLTLALLGCARPNPNSEWQEARLGAFRLGRR
jgi:hypothetical protein